MCAKERRSDAAARRVALLDAAAEVFIEQGVGAPLDEIADRAGVGRATFYRNFADRGELMLALLEREHARLEELVREEPLEKALMAVIDAIASGLVDNPALADFWRALPGNREEFAIARARFARLVTPGLEKAIADKQVRPDLGPEDILIVSGMLGAILRGHDRAERRRIRQRVQGLLLHGLLPRPALGHPKR
jgi:AcrR family transcriptional regulator